MVNGYTTDEELETKLLLRPAKTTKELLLVLNHVERHGKITSTLIKDLKKYRKSTLEKIWSKRALKLYNNLIKSKNKSKRKKSKRRRSKRSKSKRRRSKRRRSKPRGSKKFNMSKRINALLNIRENREKWERQMRHQKYIKEMMELTHPTSSRKNTTGGSWLPKLHNKLVVQFYGRRRGHKEQQKHEWGLARVGRGACGDIYTELSSIPLQKDKYKYQIILSKFCTIPPNNTIMQRQFLIDNKNQIKQNGKLWHDLQKLVKNRELIYNSHRA